MVKSVRGRALFIIVSMFVIVGIVAGILYGELQEGAAQYPDVFSQQGIVIHSEQTVGTALAVNGDVYVAGTVLKRVIVLNGDLLVSQTGRIEGVALVLNGRMSYEAGSYAQSFLHLVLGGGSRLTNGIVLTVLMSIVVGIPLAAMAFIIGTRYLLMIPLYRRLQETMLFLKERKPGLYLLFGMAACMTMLLLFFHLAQETLWANEMDLVDSLIIWVVRYYASPFWDKIMLAFTGAGSAYFLALTALVLVAVQAFYRRRREGMAIGVCLGGGVLLNILLKNIFARPRPDVLPVISATGYSFPSGHAMIALCFYGISAYLLSRLFPTFFGRMLVFLLTGILVMMIGISRIYLGVHYPSDVLAGYAAGATWLAFCISLLAWHERKQPASPPS
ncbi:MAG: phosphoesterase PA-phosphatase related protein [Firmicutes bacterium]|nr:phosphoesterase PA-phosphatase related protein [Bacillota bacterium]